MEPKLILIVAEGCVATKIAPTISRLLGLAAHVQRMGSLRRMIERLVDSRPDMIFYANSASDGGFGRWLNGQNFQREDIRCVVLTCTGFNQSLVPSVDRTVTKLGGARCLSFAA